MEKLIPAIFSEKTGVEDIHLLSRRVERILTVSTIAMRLAAPKMVSPEMAEQWV